MCLVAWSIDQHARFPLVLASNRDEFRDRPTAALSWWPERPDGARILAGRDLQAGGTWLGLSTAGRLTLLTNIRAPGRQRPDAPSRGAIVPDWLDSPLPPEQLWPQTAQAGHNGFNLVSFDLLQGRCHWLNSDRPAPQRLSAGLYGLSNGVLDEPWPKVVALRESVDETIRQALDPAVPREFLADRLLQVLGRRERADDAQLPSTGVPLEIERGLSAICIDMPERGYGTRSSTVLVVERVGTTASPRYEATLIERTLGDDGQPVGRQMVDLPQWPPVDAAQPLLRAP
ncbi:NRDE family protein [Leptothrix sp. BB-4]